MRPEALEKYGVDGERPMARRRASGSNDGGRGVAA